MTSLCLIPACLRSISTPNGQTSPGSAKRLRLNRWLPFAVILVTTAQRSAAQATIQVNTTQQGVTAGQCSLQEAIYSKEFLSNIAIDSTDPDHTYTTGCVAGTGKGDTTL